MKNNTIKEIIDVIANAKNPLFICHENPDGDTYGAAFALRLGMDMADKHIACASKIDWPFTKLGIADTLADISNEDNDLYVYLDCADEHRCGTTISDYFKKDVPSINIDHHQSNTYYGDYNYVIESSSTCELVFSILIEYADKISQQVANYLYMGVATDTGLFVHGYTTANTHYVAARLLEFGAEFDIIAKLLFRTVSMQTALLAGKLYNNLEIVDNKIAISYLTQKDFEAAGANYEDSEGLITHLTNIDKMDICIFLKQQDKDTYKASLRSTKEYDICKLAMVYGGGGHKQAAGCRLKGKIGTIKEQIKEQIKQLNII